MNFKQHLSSYLNDKEIEDLISSLSKKSVSACLLNLEKMKDDEFLSLFPNVKRHPIIPHAYIYNKDEYHLGKTIYHELGAFYIQEPSAMLVSYLLKPNEKDIVLDMCAAPGGKTIQASLLMNNKGLIISNDISFPRLKALVENVERLGRGNIVIANNDFDRIYQNYLNTFDKIILDAPCSGSGMFRKDDKMLEDWTYNKVLKNQEIQKSLIQIAYKMLKRGGTLVYSTCSFSYEEDEEVVQSLLTNTDAELLDLNSEYFYKSKSKIGVHLLPNIFEGEGHYICLIRKPGNNKSVSEIIIKTTKIGSDIYQSNQGFNLKYLNVLRNGVKVGEKIKDDIKYHYHYTHYINDFDNVLSIDKEDLDKYMNGESLFKDSKKGHILLKYHNMNVDIAKSSGQIIKNKLPKVIKLKSYIK